MARRGARFSRVGFLGLCSLVLWACGTTPSTSAPPVASATARPAGTAAASGVPSLGAAPAARGLVAFDGAEGFGAMAVGGRGGDVYHVTSLGDVGPGTLRTGISSAAGPRTIVFDVAGTIVLTSKLTINKPFLTIAGQTAPGGRPCIISTFPH